MSKIAKRRSYISRNNDAEASPPILLDSLNINIIKELMGNADVRSALIASKYRNPLSTIQRRRTKLERSILKKAYRIDLRKLGWRKADLLVAVEKGNCEEVAKKLLGNKSVISASLRIGDPDINVMAEIFYGSSEDLHNLIESMRALPSVASVEWSEIVKVVGSNDVEIIDRLFSASPK